MLLGIEKGASKRGHHLLLGIEKGASLVINGLAGVEKRAGMPRNPHCATRGRPRADSNFKCDTASLGVVVEN
ncbi:MAG: hypothetical protein WD063_02330, partial [Pirellulales bacterium]